MRTSKFTPERMVHILRQCDVPKTCPSRSAVSPVMVRWPFRMPVVRFVRTLL